MSSIVIDGGSIKGSNLFHSFSEFNIDAGQSVYFTNPNNINNIFTRVTGANISNINGTLGVLGNANLFFLNPNGITFGATQGINTFTLSFIDNNTQLTSTCSAVNGNKFTISGRGGLPALPIQPLLGETIWQDFRDNDNIISYQQKTRASMVNNNLDLVEATGWVVDNKGKVELVTEQRVANPQHNWYSAPNCR